MYVCVCMCMRVWRISEKKMCIWGDIYFVAKASEKNIQQIHVLAPLVSLFFSDSGIS